jgi:hypothetical protein
VGWFEPLFRLCISNLKQHNLHHLYLLADIRGGTGFLREKHSKPDYNFYIRANLDIFFCPIYRFMKLSEAIIRTLDLYSLFYAFSPGGFLTII